MSEAQELSGEGYRVRIQDEPITIENRKIEKSGARVTFSGLVRPTEIGKSIRALKYESYESMAIKSLESIAKETGSQLGLLYVSIIHRTGVVDAGEASVVVDVYAGHRNSAFRACSLIMERIKTETPIWKKIVFDDGNEEWKDVPDHDQRETD